MEKVHSILFSVYYSVCVFIYKILNNVVSRNRMEIVESDSERQIRQQIRQVGSIVLEFRKIRNAQKSVFYKKVKMYNSLPVRIKQRDGLRAFKRELKKYILNTIQYF